MRIWRASVEDGLAGGVWRPLRRRWRRHAARQDLGQVGRSRQGVDSSSRTASATAGMLSMAVPAPSRGRCPGSSDLPTAPTARGRPIGRLPKLRTCRDRPDRQRTTRRGKPDRAASRERRLPRCLRRASAFLRIRLIPFPTTALTGRRRATSTWSSTLEALGRQPPHAAWLHRRAQRHFHLLLHGLWARGL